MYFKSLMKTSIILTCLIGVGFVYASEEKPVQHLKLKDVTDAATAKTVFTKDTEALRAKKSLDAKAMQDIHMITYSLEKSVAYYVESGDEKLKLQAKKLADVVEELHLSSENLRKEASMSHLKEYLILADKFKMQI